MKIIRVSKVVSAALLSTVCLLNATSLQDAVKNTVQQNPQLKAIGVNNEAFKKYVDEAKGGYLPKIDLQVTGESKQIKTKDKDTEAKNTTDYDGYNAQLKVEQLIYDGGLTTSKVEEAEFGVQVNTLSNTATIEQVMFEGIQSYLNLVKYDLRLNLSEQNVATHQDYLQTAKSNEELTGNALDTYEVTSKLHLAKKNYIEEINNQQLAQNSFKRLTGSEPEGNVCMPLIDRSVLPQQMKELVDYAVANNATVLAQMAKIKQQRAILNQEKSKFLPTLKFELSGSFDDDTVTHEFETETYSAKIVMTYNLYNGGRDQASNEREEFFLKESQHVLDSKTDLVVDEITSAYNSYNNSQRKINELEGYVKANEEILAIYKDQFEGGTRTFVDVLDIESDLYNAKIQLIDEKITLAETFYQMLSITSQLQSVVVNQPNQICSNKVVEEPKVAEKQDELAELKAVIEDANTVDYTANYGALIADLEKEFANEIANGSVEFDKKDLSFRMTAPTSSMPIGKDGMLVMTNDYKNTLKDFMPRFVKTVKPYKNDIKQINVDGYASTNFLVAKNDNDNFIKNLAVSKKRAGKVLDYIRGIKDPILSENKDILNMFKAYGRSYANPVVNSDGTENRDMSKRVEIAIEGK